jgi:hypothetical protein
MVIATGCTTVGDTPATVPPTSIAPTSTVFSPGTIVSTTIAEPATSTTVDRLTEIAAIFEDLERRRLQAIFDQDEEAFRAVHANDAYLNESLVVLDLVDILDPTADFRQVAIRLIAETETCIAAELDRDYTGILDSGERSSDIYVAELTASASSWGLVWVGGGWACDGPHPLS